jgi:hypothetical protein
VNAYVGEPRMTQDIDVLSLQAASLAEELRRYLSERFYIAVRVRMVKGGRVIVEYLGLGGSASNQW